MVAKFQTVIWSAISSMKFGEFILFYIEICLLRCGWWEVTIGLDDGLVPNRCQAIINVDPVQWCIYE